MIADDELSPIDEEELRARRDAIGVEAGRVEVIPHEVGEHDREAVEGAQGTRKERRVDTGFISRCDELRAGRGLDPE
jgi:hypothetical protein